ncbi:DUF6115 domain-containing protein [Salibacterium sp. K-3]
MTIVLLVFSVALHIITFFVLAFFYQQLRKVTEERRELHGMRDDMEKVLRQYIDEIKQENLELKQYVDASSGKENRPSGYPKDETEQAKPEAEVGPGPHIQERQKPSPVSRPEMEDEDTFPPPPEPGEDEADMSAQARVLSLSARGWSRDEIAKELQIGKGEVDLFLKFYQ